MDRQTLAQAAALLVVVCALVRWLPAPGDGGPSRRIEDADVLGRGMPLEVLTTDWRQSTSTEERTAWVARMLGATRPALFTPRFYQLLVIVDHILESAGPDDVVQLRNVSRNEQWIARYYLYPMRVVGEPGQGEDEAPLLDDADWVVRGGDVRLEPSGDMKTEPFRLERRP